MSDWTVHLKYIDENRLPENARLVNEPYHFYKVNRKTFWNIMGVFFFLVTILFYLMVNIIKRRSVEEKIKDQLSFMQILMHTIPIPIDPASERGRDEQNDQEGSGNPDYALTHWK